MALLENGGEGCADGIEEVDAEQFQGTPARVGHVVSKKIGGEVGDGNDDVLNGFEAGIEEMNVEWGGLAGEELAVFEGTGAEDEGTREVLEAGGDGLAGEGGWFEQAGIGAG